MDNTMDNLNDRSISERAAEKAREGSTYLGTHSAQEMADDARDAASNVADDARGTLDDARAKVEDLAGRAKDKASEVGSQAADKIDSAMTSAGNQMDNLAQKVMEKAPDGPLGDAAVNAAGALERGGRYLQQADVESIRGDLEGIIRRRPLESLAVGLGLGFIIARGLRK